jgi:hypothetical protein
MIQVDVSGPPQLRLVLAQCYRRESPPCARTECVILVGPTEIEVRNISNRTARSADLPVHDRRRPAETGPQIRVKKSHKHRRRR